MGLRKCFWYLISISVLSFFVGRALPKNWFHADWFPYRAFSFENDGKIYEKLRIQKWQNRLPDMSRILPFMMPAKRITSASGEKMPRMIQETCVAEFIHCMNSLAGLYCIVICPEIAGWITSFFYATVLNFPFVLIQRYNRPRLVALCARLQQRKKRIARQKAASSINEDHPTRMAVLILSGNTGEGHNSCAKAIAEYFESQNQRCVVRDGLAFISPAASKFVSWGHSFVYRHLPLAFKYGYKCAERHPTVFHKGSIVYRLITRSADRLYAYIQKEKFDCVICTHVFPALILTEMRRRRPIELATGFVVTDYTCSPSVKDTDLDRYFIPDDSLTGDFESPNIPAEKMVASGIPVRQMFYRVRGREEAAAISGIDPAHRHLLMMCGSIGCGPMQKLLRKLQPTLPEDWEITVICGHNARRMRSLQRRYKNARNVHIRGFVDDMGAMMDCADLYLTKPGGISVSEAAAKKLPMVLIDAVAGCEEYNRALFIRCGGAVTGANAQALADACSALARDAARRGEMANRLWDLGKRNSAQIIYNTMKSLTEYINDEEGTEESLAACD